MKQMKQIRRSSIEIRCDILYVVAKSPQRKTWILYKANLNIASLHRHLKSLVENGLISETITKMKSGNRNRYTYCITPKGINICHHCCLIQKALAS
jgi:predicted transcriptional regulator